MNEEFNHSVQKAHSPAWNKWIRFVACLLIGWGVYRIFGAIGIHLVALSFFHPLTLSIALSGGLMVYGGVSLWCMKNNQALIILTAAMCAIVGLGLYWEFSFDERRTLLMTDITGPTLAFIAIITVLISRHHNRNLSSN